MYTYILKDVRNNPSLIAISEEEICFLKFREEVFKFDGDKVRLVNHLEKKFNIKIIIPNNEVLLDLSKLKLKEGEDCFV